MGGDDLRIRRISRMLNGSEVVHLISRRHNYHSAGVLTGGALDAGAADSKAVHFAVIELDIIVLAVLLDIAVSGLVSDSGDSSRLEHVGLAEKLFGVAVGGGLVFAGEVKVDIRGFFAMESQECLERNVMTVTVEVTSALGANLRRQVES